MMATPTFNASQVQQERFDRIFRQELQPLMDAICSFAYRLTGERSAADDLVQETYLKAWRFIGRYHEGTNARAWMFRICRNAFINDYRIRKNDPTIVDVDQLGNKSAEDDQRIVWVGQFSTDLTDPSLSDEMLDALNKLPEEFRMVVSLDMEDFSYEEMAAIIGIPVGTVRSRLHRARKSLAKELQEYAQTQGYSVRDEEMPTADNRGKKGKC
jgi:RNA polymerase sigma factor (sigma-70 family)